MPWILRKASPGKKSNLRPGYCTDGCTGFWLGLAAGWVFWAEFGALVVGFEVGNGLGKKEEIKNPPDSIGGVGGIWADVEPCPGLKGVFYIPGP